MGVGDKIVALPTRADVTQPYLLLANEGGGAPRAVAVLLPGGDGVVGLPADIEALPARLRQPAARPRALAFGRDMG